MRQATDVTVGALVERDGKYLIIEERVSGALVLTQPGGHIEAGESPEDAARREALEEAGCEIDIHCLLGVYRWVQPRTKRQFLRILFLADLLEERPNYPLDTGIEAVHWMSLAALRRRRHDLRTPVVTRCIEDYRAGRRQPFELLRRMSPIQRNVPAILANAAVV